MVGFYRTLSGFIFGISRSILFLVFLQLSYDSYGQFKNIEDFDYTDKAEVKSVEFLNLYNNLFPVYPDGEVDPYSGPQYQKDKKVHPTAFLRKSVPHLTIILEFTCPTSIQNVKEIVVHGRTRPDIAEAFAMHINEVARRKSTFMMVNGKLQVTMTTNIENQFLKPDGSEYTLPDHVDYILDMSIDWTIEVKLKDSNQLITLSDMTGLTSKHELYVTMDRPYEVTLNPTNLQRFAPFHSLYYISCQAAKGKTEREDVINLIWQELEGLNVMTRSGETLTYYGNPSIWNQCTTTALLLKNKDGICFAWASFFIDLLKVQGIKKADGGELFDGNDCADCDKVQKILFPPPVNSAEMPCNFIYNVGLSGMDVGIYMVEPNITMHPHPNGAGSICPYSSNPHDFPFTNSLGDTTSNIKMIASFFTDTLGNVTWEYVFEEGFPKQFEIGPVFPVQGHNNHTPQFFVNHVVVHLDEVYYDPSYGKKYNSINEIRNGLAGWAIEFPSLESIEFGGDVDGEPDNDDVIKQYIRFTSNTEFWDFH